MSIDTYSYCPCGSGKKLKFCCCKDLVHELEKVIRAMEGEQRVSAIDQIERLIHENGKRPALLALQAQCHIQSGNLDEAEKLGDTLLELVPHSPVALANQSIVHAFRGETDRAVELLQQALEVAEGGVTAGIYAAVGVVGHALLRENKLHAFRGHVMLQASFQLEGDDEPLRALAEIDNDPSIPLLFKLDLEFAESPAGVPWQGEFSAAMKSARRGAWRAACESLESLDHKVPNQPAVWKNIAIVRTWLGQQEQAVAAWQKYASLPGLPLDEAIEAEALGVALAPMQLEDLVDVMRLTYSVADVERLNEFLLSDKRAEAFLRSPDELEEGEPPPKGSFFFLDRPMPSSADQIQSVADLPIVLAEMDLYGRQTDREPRIEILIDRTNDFVARQTAVEKYAGEFLGKFENEIAVGKKLRTKAQLAPPRRMPDFLDPHRQVDFTIELNRLMMMNDWPSMPTSILAGRPPREAATIPELRNRVSALILSQELSSEQSSADSKIDFNELRRSLGLPERVEADIPKGQIQRVSFLRLGRLNYSKLDDKDLFYVFTRLAAPRYSKPLEKCALELLNRPSLANHVKAQDLYQLLVGISGGSEIALNYIDKGRKLSAAAGESTARWYLMELQVRLLRGESEEFNRVLNTIFSRFGNDNKVREQLYRILVRFGLINPDGTPVAPTAPRAAASPTQANVAQPAAGAAIWTPDSPTAAPPKQESKLWLPGT